MPVPYGYTAVRVIKEAILRSQYRAASAANKKQLSLSKTPVKAFGAKVLLIPLAGNYKRCCHIQNFRRNAREIKKGIAQYRRFKESIPSSVLKYYRNGKPLSYRFISIYCRLPFWRLPDE